MDTVWMGTNVGLQSLTDDTRGATSMHLNTGIEPPPLLDLINHTSGWGATVTPEFVVTLLTEDATDSEVMYSNVGLNEPDTQDDTVVMEVEVL